MKVSTIARKTRVVNDMCLSIVDRFASLATALHALTHVTMKAATPHANRKELRFDAADGAWRIAFAFDPKRWAVLLVAGDKSGGSRKRFYKQLIRKADDRFDAHLERIEEERK